MKNLRVDVILPSERRSTSPVSLKLVGRVILITVVASVGISSALFFIKIRTTQNRLEDITEQWEVMDKKVKNAENLKRGSHTFRTVVDELKRRNRSRVAWDEQMEAWQRIVPENIQLTTIMISDPIKGKAWQIKATFNGRAGGEDPAGEVDSFVDALKKDEILSGYVDKAYVDPGSFRRATRGNMNEMTFIVIVEYKKRSFK